jgi:hypothetical protein
MRSLPRTLALAIACLGSLPVAAQGTKPRLELRTTSNQTVFHIGERIALTLTLTGPDNKKYSIDTANYDRSGRLDIDTFEVSPATGWSDPLAQYFSQGAFMGGGLRGAERLSSKPISFSADLNEHIRFDQPGAYTVTATSHRVGASGESLFPREPYLSLSSNAIKIRVIPATAEWQAEKLHSILAVLAAPVKKPRSAMPSEELSAAFADLRFLNSPAAIEELASHLREDLDDSHQNLKWAAALGLSGVPDSLRDVALHAMSRQLDDPDFPVCGWFLTIMAGLEAGPEDTAAELQTSRDARFTTVWQLALSGLPRKQGSALSSTAETLLSDAPAGETDAFREQVAATVARTFTALPIDRQVSELEYDWDVLSRQPMLPVLQSLLHQTPSKVGSPFYSVADLNAIVLKRWYELDPEGALREVTLQLASPNAALSPRSINSFPGGSQPQFEAAWARELLEEENDERQTLLAALLVRFGTGAATSQVESKLDSHVGKWACAPQAAALAYLVKFNSDNAAALLHRAMASTHETQCYETLFSAVSEYAHGPALDEAAILALHNPNPRAAADAAQYLRSFGTESTKQPLLERYGEWNEEYSNKPGEVDPAKTSGYPLSTLGQNLGEALIANQAWLADAKLTAEVLKRCVGEQMCGELQRLASEASSPAPYVTVSHSILYENYQIGPYCSKSLELFEAKLAQFPKGAKFTLMPTSPRSGDQLKLEHEAQALFTKHGMTLELPDAFAAAKSSAQ